MYSLGSCNAGSTAVPANADGGIFQKSANHNLFRLPSPPPLLGLTHLQLQFRD